MNQFTVSMKQDDDTRKRNVFNACDALHSGKYPKIFIEGTDLYIKLGPINTALKYASEHGECLCLDTFQHMIPKLFAKANLPNEYYRLYESVCYDANSVL